MLPKENGETLNQLSQLTTSLAKAQEGFPIFLASAVTPCFSGNILCPIQHIYLLSPTI